ncbi:glycoside hydrolase family 32 protein [Zhihengliuella flava]|uniref:beta-fructofuranosidase n=1 Tax=Zhihengliuella flava TaxID=1285193 RepID=A0A931DBI8_9MICC|nr:glycoside hydrolase family 32 protein [Zhihengliuella flava]MBG6083843.1 beta-fructofuranosidase [Zhihengliuella flava]
MKGPLVTTQVNHHDTHGAAAATSDPLRPVIHPRPEAGWLNDPNGLLRHDGRYHVFCQYNPESARHHRISWAHLSSADLVSWREHPVAISPDDDAGDAFGCWSGVATVDAGTPTLVYTGVRQDGGASAVLLARSSDSELNAWEKAPAPATGMPRGESFTDVRDPFLFTFAGRRYALQGAGSRGGDPALLLYDAEDLTSWRYLGRFLDTGDGVAREWAEAEIWECPQLVELDGRWVLLLSLWRWVDDRHRLESVAYLVGDIETDEAGTLLRFAPTAGGRADTGPDFYAPQALAEEDRTLMWGWSWEGRAETYADAAGWAGVLTLPRTLGLEAERLVVAPAPELAALRGSRATLEPGPVHVVSDPAEIAVAGAVAAGAEIEVLLVSEAGERPVLAIAAEGARVFIDRSIVEAFRGGSVSHTVRAYPEAGEEWAVRVTGAVADAWALETMSVEYRVSD